jgi:hypothetical protein
MSIKPPKVVINHPLVFGIGTGLWAVALVVLALAYAGGHHDLARWVWVAGVGTALGIVGTLYARYGWRARQELP